MLVQQALLASSVAGQAFNISIWDGNDGSTNMMRMWYGDGQAYVGDVVPPEIEVAFNITSPSLTPPDVLETIPDSTTTLNSSESFYLAVTTAPSAAEDPLFFLTAAQLAAAAANSTRSALWGAYEGLLFPMNSGGTSNAAGIPYLGPTSVEGTWVVRWSVSGKSSENAQRVVQIMAREPPGQRVRRDWNGGRRAQEE